MRMRKNFKRICSVCKKEEMVRSDQLKRICKDCRMLKSKETLLNWIKENPEAHLECSREANKKHGLWDTRIYRIYRGMLIRCGHTKTIHRYALYYSDKGIKVCEEWLKDRTSFFNWAFQNGYNDNLQIDRIDSDKGYSPDNCRWVTPKENQANRKDRKSAVPLS
jgi:hypothetical protein